MQQRWLHIFQATKMIVMLYYYNLCRLENPLNVYTKRHLKDFTANYCFFMNETFIVVD